MVKNNFPEPQNHRKLNFLRPTYFLKISAHRFEDLICTNNLEGFFFEYCFFQVRGAFFTTTKSLIWASFFATKNNFILFSKDYYLI